MIVPIYLILRYSEGFKVYLRENVSDPEDYDLDWLKKTMLILSSMYIFIWYCCLRIGLAYM